jgi:phosphopantothenoylcysteine decarboxylase/phosphopantothenate--cysteine ligase
MGYAVAREAARRGAAVKLVSGPVTLEKPDKVEIINVVTAKEMHKAVLDNYKDCNVLVMAAAVADYRSTRISEKKIKKTGDNLVLELVKNPDIAKDMGKLKGDRIMVGFSAETDNLINNAKSKLESKNFDMIVANDVTKEGAGFNTDTNIVTFIKKDYSMRELPIMSKEAVAGEMLNEIMGIMNSR